MPRLPRIHVDNTLYFVTSQSGQNQNLFYDATDYEGYLELLDKYKKEHGFKLFGFVLLPKYLHLLIEPKQEAPISTIMHNLNSAYTKMFNSRYNKKGHLFQGRFKAKLIEKDGYLLNLTRYLHLSPKRSGLTDQPKEYPYCSYSFYLAIPHHKLPEMKAEIDEVLNAFHEEDKIAAYEHYMNSTETQEMDQLESSLRRKHFLGSEQFIMEIKKKIELALIEEETTKVEVRPNKTFILVGSMVILVLGATAIHLYSQILGWSHKLEMTTKEFSQNFSSVQTAFKEATKKPAHPLNGLTWEIELIPVGGINAGKSWMDQLSFADDQLISANLKERGFPASTYSMINQDDGSIVWQTTLIQEDGSKVSWYGVWTGKVMRGLLSERPACRQAGRFDCTNRDFSFISTRRLKNG